MKYVLALLCLAIAGGVGAQGLVDEPLNQSHWTAADPWSRDACLYITGYSERLPDPRYLPFGPAGADDMNPEFPYGFGGPWEQQDFKRCFWIVYMLRMSASAQQQMQTVPAGTENRDLGVINGATQQMLRDNRR